MHPALAIICYCLAGGQPNPTAFDGFQPPFTRQQAEIFLAVGRTLSSLGQADPDLLWRRD